MVYFLNFYIIPLLQNQSGISSTLFEWMPFQMLDLLSTLDLFPLCDWQRVRIILQYGHDYWFVCTFLYVCKAVIQITVESRVSCCFAKEVSSFKLLMLSLHLRVLCYETSKVFSTFYMYAQEPCHVVYFGVYMVYFPADQAWANYIVK